MTFLLDAAFAIELISLSLGAGLLIWSLRNQGTGVALGKVIGSLVLILSTFMLFCTTYSGLRYWAKGSFETSSDMTMGMRNEMMEKMMPFMMKKMMEQMGNMQNKEQMKKGSNMYNMEHLQNMGSQQSMEHMQQKEPDKGKDVSQ